MNSILFLRKIIREEIKKIKMLNEGKARDLAREIVSKAKSTFRDTDFIKIYSSETAPMFKGSLSDYGASKAKTELFNKIQNNMSWYYVQLNEHGGYVVFDDGSVYWVDGTEDTPIVKIKNWKTDIMTIEEE